MKKIIVLLMLAIGFSVGAQAAVNTSTTYLQVKKKHPKKKVHKRHHKKKVHHKHPHK